jgi:hypothetical protein
MVIDLGNRRSSPACPNIFTDTFTVIGSTPAVKNGGVFVQVKLFTQLAKYISGVHPGAPFICKILQGSTITDLLKHLRISEREVSMVFVNGLHRPCEYQLRNDDNISVFPQL